MSKFIFKDYDFDPKSKTATFRYEYKDKIGFEERIQFSHSDSIYDREVLDRALFLSFILAGTSYYKAFPTKEVELEKGSLDQWQVDFFTSVYHEGLGQFAFENSLTRHELALFHTSTLSNRNSTVNKFEGKGILALQSGGKDSLLTATLLRKCRREFNSWYVSSSVYHPKLLDTLESPLRIATRTIDKAHLAVAASMGAMNGHVPVTFIVASYAVVDAILNGLDTILLSNGHEGEEPHGWIGDLPVNHQWSKTWSAEKALSEYVTRYISSTLSIGSPLRAYTELKVAELFVRHAWSEYGHQFSSCNRANYGQGKDNTKLKWCGECPKCANSFLLFAPFLPADELKALFNGQDLFAKPMLEDTFKGLLGIDGVMKPFECVGEVDELRSAYHKACQRGDYQEFAFEVPISTFDYTKEYEAQEWARQMIQ